MCFFGQGSIRAATGTTLGVLGTSKMKENKRFYGFTDFRGKPEKRGRCSRATANQVTAGQLELVPAYQPSNGEMAAYRRMEIVAKYQRLNCPPESEWSKHGGVLRQIADSLDMPDP